MPEHGKIDTHESKKGSEVKKLASVLVSIAYVIESDRTRVGHGSDQYDVVSRSIGFRMEMSKEPARKDAVAPHSKKKSGRPKTAREAASQRRQNQDHSHRLKEWHTAYTVADIHECCFKIGERVPVRPDTLSQVDLNAAEHACEYADKNSSKQYIPTRIPYIFRKGSDSIKPNVGEGRERCSAPDQVWVECLRVVEGFG